MLRKKEKKFFGVVARRSKKEKKFFVLLDRLNGRFPFDFLFVVLYPFGSSSLPLHRTQIVIARSNMMQEREGSEDRRTAL